MRANRAKSKELARIQMWAQSVLLPTTCNTPTGLGERISPAILSRALAFQRSDLLGEASRQGSAPRIQPARICQEGKGDRRW